VRFLGALDHAQLAVAYASCDLFCAPSMPASNGDLDGMPTVLAEAAASGLPLLGSNIAGLPLMIEPERTGLLVPPGDATALTAALTRLLGDAQLRERLGRGALDKAQAFTWRRIATRFVDIYAEAAERHRLREPNFAL
jgi:glycosyltransferase involved in cell wall biosynthesis